jgi:mRNA interferase MazF
MPSTTGFEFGDVVLVPFPFTDQTTTKHCPAVVVSSADYQRERADVILLAITSQQRPLASSLEIAVQHWQHASLIKPSVLKPLVTTVERRLIFKKVGKLHTDDRCRLSELLSKNARRLKPQRRGDGTARLRAVRRGAARRGHVASRLTRPSTSAIPSAARRPPDSAPTTDSDAVCLRTRRFLRCVHRVAERSGASVQCSAQPKSQTRVFVCTLVVAGA